MTNIIKFEQEIKQLDHLKMLAKIASESKQYATMTEIQLYNLMLSARDLGISPMKAINGGFYIVNGKVCMSTAMMAERIRKQGHSIKIIEMTKDKCVIIAKRKDNEDSLKLEYTMEEAHAAGLTASPTWKKYPKSMLYNRCMSQVARILFPDVVGNSYSEEERFDIQNVPPEKRPLEEDSEEIVLDTPIVVPSRITENQCAELDSLLIEINDDKVEQFVCKRAEVEEIYDIAPEKFAGVVKYLKDQLKKKRETVNESTGT